MRCIGLVLFLLVAAGLRAETKFVHAEGKYLVDGAGHRLMLRGTNLGNWMVPEGYMFRFEQGPASPREIETLVNELIGPADAAKFWDAYRDQYITKSDIDFIRKSGLNTIRIPMHYRFFEGQDARGFALLDRVIEWSKQAGLYVILDMHCAPGGQTGTNIDDSWGYPWLYESVEKQKELADVWTGIAARYRDNATVIGYDLLNEPIPTYPSLAKYNAQLEPIYKQVTAAIRTVDKNHVIILGGAQWDGNFAVFGEPFDKNMMYTFHKYWMPPTVDSVKEYIAFRDRYNVPIWMGESGENTNEWISQFAKVLDENGINWTFWPYKKMEKNSAPVTFGRPVYWDEIVAYAKRRAGTGEAEKSLTVRPSLEHSRAAMQDLLEKIRFENCTVNEGYLKALGVGAK